MVADDAEESYLREFFATLSHEARLAIAGALASRSATAAAIAATTGLRTAEVVKELGVLQHAGIARAVAGADPVCWELDIPSLRARRQELLARGRRPSPADEPGTPEWEQSVLASFFDGETLREFPAQQKKKLVVLGWLAQRFELGRQYPERAVNDVLRRHHPDTAMLRRALVDYRFMSRENGVYWREQP